MKYTVLGDFGMLGKSYFNDTFPHSMDDVVEKPKFKKKQQRIK